MTAIAVGQEWVYRLRDTSPSERVRVLTVEQRKNSTRVEIEFVDANPVRIENVPRGRLRVPWSEVENFDAAMANWQRLGGFQRTEAEEQAVGVVFGRLIPEEVAEYDTGWSNDCVAVYDRVALESLTGRSVESFASAASSFEDDDAVWMSAQGGLLIAEAACRAKPMAVLEWVVSEERRCREAAKRGAGRQRLDGEKYTSDPDWEYQYYLRYERSVHELLRQWCGHRAITLQERLAAAEAEVHRLDELLARAADAMRDNKLPGQAQWLDEEHERDRITPFNVRPVVERPLDVDEIPVQVVYRRGRWAR